MFAATFQTDEEQGRPSPKPELTPVERALLRLMVNGYTSEEASAALGMAPAEAHSTLKHLQTRCGVSNFTRLIVLAVLNAWV
jgi:DNA-binding CsgD family transcriptional regulator